MVRDETVVQGRGVLSWGVGRAHSPAGRPPLRMNGWLRAVAAGRAGVVGGAFLVRAFVEQGGGG